MEERDTVRRVRHVVERGGTGRGLGVAGVSVGVTEGVNSLERGRSGSRCMGGEEDENKGDEAHFTSENCEEMGSRHFLFLIFF